MAPSGRVALGKGVGVSLYSAPAHLRYHGFIGIGIHDGIIISVPPVPAKLPCISFHLLNGTCLGCLPSERWWDSSPGSDSFEPTLGPGDIAFMGRTNDAGFIVPHVSIPPNNSLLPLTIAFGGSISLLGASSVKMNTHNIIFQNSEADMSCSLFPFWLSLNLGCSDPVPIPSDIVITPNTVEVGVEWADILAAVIDLAIEYAMCGLAEAGGAAVKKIKDVRKSRRVADTAGQTVLEEAQEAATDSAKRSLTTDKGFVASDAMKWSDQGRNEAADQARNAANDVVGEARTRVDDNVTDLDDLARQRTAVENHQNSIGDAMDEIEVDRRAIDDELADQARAREELVTRRNELETARVEADADAAAAREQATNSTRELEVADQKLADNEVELEAASRRAAELENARQANEVEIEGLNEQIDEVAEARRQNAQDLETARANEPDQVEALEAEARELELEADQLDQDLKRLEEQRGEIANDIETQQTELNDLEAENAELTDAQRDAATKAEADGSAAQRAETDADAAAEEQRNRGAELDEREAEIDDIEANLQREQAELQDEFDQRVEERRELERQDAALRREERALETENERLLEEIELAEEWIETLQSAGKWENFKKVWTLRGPDVPNAFRPFADGGGSLPPAGTFVRNFLFGTFKFFVGPGGAFSGSVAGAGTGGHVSVEISSDEPSPTSTAAFEVEIEFSHPVLFDRDELQSTEPERERVFCLGNIEVWGAGASELTAVDGDRESDGERFASKFTLLLSPNGRETIDVKVPDRAAYRRNSDGLYLPCSSGSYEHAIDAEPPSVVELTGEADDSGAPVARLEVRFSEEILPLAASSVQVEGGQLQALAEEGRRRWSFEVVAAKSPGVVGPEEVTVDIVIDEFQDLVGNLNEPDGRGLLSYPFVLDGPTVQIAAADVDADGPPVSGPFEITVEFSSPVTGFTASDVVVVSDNATLGAATGSNPDADVPEAFSTYTLLVTPDDGLSDEELRLRVPAAVAQDTSGSDETPGADNYASADWTVRVDNVAPELESLTSEEPDPTNAESFVVTVRFSEPVTGLEMSDFELVKATASALSPEPSEATYEYELTVVPDDGLAGDTVEIELGPGVVTDVAGNASTGTARLERFVDNVGGAVISLTTDADSPATTDEITATVTFSAPILTSSFGGGDIDPLDGAVIVRTSVAANDATTDADGNLVATEFTFEFAPPAGEGLVTVGARVGPGAGTDALGNETKETVELYHEFDRPEGYAPPSDVVAAGRLADPGFHQQYLDDVSGMSAETQAVVAAQGGPSDDGSSGSL